MTPRVNEMAAAIDRHIVIEMATFRAYMNGATGTFPEAAMRGIPDSLTAVMKHIFTHLPADDAVRFLREIPRAIAHENKNLDSVIWKFLIETMRAMPPQNAKIQTIIDDVISGLKLCADGQSWPETAARAAAEAAVWAAASEAARAAASEAARAAASEAARAAAWKVEIQRQRDSIIKLIKEA